MGFLGDMELLSSAIRPDRQMVFFSATWPQEVKSLANSLCTSGHPLTMHVSSASCKSIGALQARESIKQDVVVIEEPEGRSKWDRQDGRKRALLDSHIKCALASHCKAKVLIFVNQKSFADELATRLWEDSIHADAIHGGRQQSQRLSVLESFRNGETRVLVATDVF